MGWDEMKRIGGWIHTALANADDLSVHKKIRGQVRDLCEHFAVPAGRVAAA
jgi:glycine/serine hydroxymethyltransferase